MSTFASLGLSDPIVSAITALGFVEPTPIQAEAIPKLLEEPTDMVGLAQTGTGKTAAFGLPLLELIEPFEPKTQALILAPTRELCLQIATELNLYSKDIKGISIKAVYGGVDIVRQMRDVKKGANIIVATPGRLRDLIRRKAVNITEIEFVILDEADEMLNMGFKDEIDDILSNTPEDKLTWLFSATMPNEVRRISREYMSNPLEISIGAKNTTNENISHQYVLTHPSDRVEVLKRFLDYDPSTFGLVFCRTRRDTMELADRLTREGYSADALHGDLSQAQRDRVMERFRAKQLQVLVATDVAARGIDVGGITHVFHFNIPDDIAFYTHRSGRTGRAGQKGISLILCHPKDMHILHRLENRVKAKFEQAHIPTGPQVCEQQLLAHIEKIRETAVSEEMQTFMPTVLEQLEEFSKEELVQRFAMLSFQRLLERYASAPDLNRGRRRQRRENGSEGGGSGNAGRNGDMQALFINVGRLDLGNKGDLLALICRESGIPGSAIGKIEMRRTHSIFAVDKNISRRVREAFADASFEGRDLHVKEDGGKGNDRKSSRGNRRGDKKFTKRRR